MFQSVIFNQFFDFDRMWRAYSSCVEVTDFKSALNYIQNELSKNVFEYEHEAVYGLGRYLSIKDCNTEAEKNTRALKLTKLYEKSKICGECWASSFIEIHKFRELEHVFQYLPEDVKLRLLFPKERYEMCNTCIDNIEKQFEECRLCENCGEKINQHEADTSHQSFSEDQPDTSHQISPTTSK